MCSLIWVHLLYVVWIWLLVKNITFVVNANNLSFVELFPLRCCMHETIFECKKQNFIQDTQIFLIRYMCPV